MDEGDGTEIKKLVAFSQQATPSLSSEETRERITEMLTGRLTCSRDAVIYFNPF